MATKKAAAVKTFKKGDVVVCPKRPINASAYAYSWGDDAMDALIGTRMKVTYVSPYRVQAEGWLWNPSWLVHAKDYRPAKAKKGAGASPSGSRSAGGSSRGATASRPSDRLRKDMENVEARLTSRCANLMKVIDALSLDYEDLKRQVNMNAESAGREQERLNDTIGKLEALTPPAPVTVEQEQPKWEPKVGDYVFITQHRFPSLVGTVQVAHGYVHANGDIDHLSGLTCGVGHGNYRKPSKAEIAAHEAKLAEEAVTELQSGNMLTCGAEDRRRIMDRAIGAGVCAHKEPTHRSSDTGVWAVADGLVWLCSDPSNATELAEPIWMRRFECTIEAKLAEEARHITEPNSPIDHERIICNR